jgi:hypothetical protein
LNNQVCPLFHISKFGFDGGDIVDADQGIISFNLLQHLSHHSMGALPLSSLMSLFPVNPLIRRAVWADTILDILDKPISDTTLFLPRVRAYRARDAALSHLFIFVGCSSCAHIKVLCDTSVMQSWTTINILSPLQ